MFVRKKMSQLEIAEIGKKIDLPADICWEVYQELADEMSAEEILRIARETSLENIRFCSFVYKPKP